MPRDAGEYSDGAFLDLIAQMLDAGMSERQVAAAFDDWFSIELLLRDGALNLTQETLAEVSRRFGWIHGGVTAFLALGITYTEYCERRNRRKHVTIEEHRPLTPRGASVPLRRFTHGHPEGEEDASGPPAYHEEQPSRYDPESVPRRAPRLRDKPLPPPPPPWLQSKAHAASPSARSEHATR